MIRNRTSRVLKNKYQDLYLCSYYTYKLRGPLARPYETEKALP